MLDRVIIALVNAWIYLGYFRVVCLHIRVTGEWPNPGCPRRLNDKFLWRKVFDRNPAFVTLSDKLESQVYARQRCPEIRVPRTLWVGNSASDIPPEILTRDVVVKATHGSGYVFPIFAGNFDRAELDARTQAWMRQTFGRRHGEWGYLGLKPRLFVEEMILDGEPGYLTTEAKLYVYCGQIGMIVMIYDRLQQSSAAVLHGDWTPSIDTNMIGASVASRPPPHNRTQIEDLALRLCEGFDHMRCDLYLVGDEVFFGEYTVYNQGGYVLLQHDHKLVNAQAEAWDIRRSWFFSTAQSGWRRIYAASLLRRLQDIHRDGQRAA